MENVTFFGTAGRRGFLAFLACGVFEAVTTMRGRKPHPTALTLIAGNPSRKKLPVAEPKPDGDLYAPPAWLTPDQQDIWRAAISNAPRGLLRQLDESLLTIWVVAADMHKQATLQVARFGMIVKSPTQGYPVQSPYLAVINRQAEIMLRVASELGFTPTSRSRITLGDAAKETNRFSNNGTKRRA